MRVQMLLHLFQLGIPNLIEEEVSIKPKHSALRCIRII